MSLNLTRTSPPQSGQGGIRFFTNRLLFPRGVDGLLPDLPLETREEEEHGLKASIYSLRELRQNGRLRASERAESTKCQRVLAERLRPAVSKGESLKELQVADIESDENPLQRVKPRKFPPVLILRELTLSDARASRYLSLGSPPEISEEKKRLPKVREICARYIQWKPPFLLSRMPVRMPL
jgi:hypothetical protein